MLEKLDFSFMAFFFGQYRSDFPPAVSISSVAGGQERFPCLLAKGFFVSKTLKLLPAHFLVNSLSLLCAHAWCDFQSLHSADEKAAGLSAICQYLGGGHNLGLLGLCQDASRSSHNRFSTCIVVTVHPVLLKRHAVYECISCPP